MVCFIEDQVLNLHTAVPSPDESVPIVVLAHGGLWQAGSRTVNVGTVEDQIWLVSFLDFDLGFFDRNEGRVEPTSNPFGPEKVPTMSPE